jgi:hypothetical protein
MVNGKGCRITSGALAIGSGALALIACFGPAWFYQRQSYGSGLYTSISITLHGLATLPSANDTQALYVAALWLIIGGTALLICGGVALAAGRHAHGLSVGAISLGVLLALVPWLLVSARPGLGAGQSDISYPFGPAAWIALAAICLGVVALALAIAARRASRGSPTVPDPAAA